MSRITDLASHTQITGYMLDIQDRLTKTQIQVSSEKKSQDYLGIAGQSQRLLQLESATTQLSRFTQNNKTMDLRLATAEKAIDGIGTALKDVRDALREFSQGSDNSETAVTDIQNWAFRTLRSLEGYLNTDIGDQYLFSGTRATTRPVDFGPDTLGEFQALFDGSQVTFPTTRESHLQDAVTFTPAQTGNLTFTAGPPGTITAAIAGSFTGLVPGTVITLSGTTANNGTYTIGGIDDPANTTTLTLNPTVTLDDNGGVPDTYGTMTTLGGYYRGDNQSVTHRVDDNQSFDFDITAVDPTFEKAIRALSIIAQGEYGTPGGLDQNLQRVDDALYLLNGVVDQVASGTPPYGDELPGSIPKMETGIAFNRVLIKDMNTQQRELTAFFEESIASIENVDSLEAVTRLLDEMNALEASYQALAKIRSLSLSNFLD